MLVVQRDLESAIVVDAVVAEREFFLFDRFAAGLFPFVGELVDVARQSTARTATLIGERRFNSANHAVHAGHRDSGSCLTVLVPDSGTWATLAPVPA